MTYSFCFSCPVRNHSTLGGVAFVTDVSVTVYYSVYNSRVPSRASILSNYDYHLTFASPDQFSSFFLSMFGSVKFYDYAQI